jgi:metal-responsive CopG/Arc/MetJ family transcriptional regulator
MSSSTKVKVILSLDTELLTAIDAARQKQSEQSRSAVVEAILHQWFLTQQRKKLEQETEAYYLALSDEEREEDQQWTQLTATQIDRLWD